MAAPVGRLLRDTRVVAVDGSRRRGDTAKWGGDPVLLDPLLPLRHTPTVTVSARDIALAINIGTYQKRVIHDVGGVLPNMSAPTTVGHVVRFGSNSRPSGVATVRSGRECRPIRGRCRDDRARQLGRVCGPSFHRCSMR